MGVYNYLTIAEVAQKINLSKNHVTRLCREGRLEGAVKVGRAWLIPNEAVEAYSKDNSKFIQAWGRRRLKQAIENAREYGKAWMFRVAVGGGGLEEWRGLDYPSFCRTLAPAFLTSDEEADCIQHLPEDARAQIAETNDHAILYDAAVEAAWDELQRLLAETAE